MGKKLLAEASKQRVLTTKEELRRAFHAFQRHLILKNSPQTSILMDEKLKNYEISYQMYNKYTDILRQTKKQAKDKIEEAQNEESESQESEQLRMKIHKEVSLPSQLENMLSNSFASYQRACDLFRKGSLMERYGNLIGHEQRYQPKPKVQELSNQELKALQKVKLIYRKYQVSSMFKSNIITKIRRQYIEKLVQKGYLKEKKEILTLIA